MLKTVIIENTKEFESLREGWNVLLSETKPDNVFLTFDWLFSCWKHFNEGRLLFIIAVFEGNQLKGVAPLALTRERRFNELRFLGSPISDYEGIIVTSDKNTRQPVMTSIIYTLRKSKKWDILRLKALRESLSSVDLFNRNLFKKSRLNFVLREHQDGAPEVNTSGEWNDYRASLRKRFLSDIRRQQTKLSDLEAELFSSKVTDRALIEPFLKKFIDMHILRRREAGGSSFFEEKDVCSFFHSIVPVFFDKGWIDLSYYKVNDKIAGMSLNFTFNKRFYHYLSAFEAEFRQYSISRLLLYEVLQRCFKDDTGKFDFMLGEENYKHFWNPRIEKLFFVTVYPGNLSGYLAYLYFYKINILLKKILGKKW